jgi:hypothetical protein
MLEEVPELEKAFRAVGGGHVLNTTTYDTAAGLLLLWELGCPATDAAGRSLEGLPLLGDDGTASFVGSVAASTPELHGALLEGLARGMARLSALVGSVGVEGLVAI